MHLAFETGLRMDLWLILRYVGEGAVDRVTILVFTQRGVAGQAGHASAVQAAATNGSANVTALGADPAIASLVRRGKGVKAFVGPVIENGFEVGLDLRTFEDFRQIQAVVAVGAVISHGIYLDLSVAIARADDGIEVHPAIKEAPRHVPQQNTQKCGCRHAV